MSPYSLIKTGLFKRAKTAFHLADDVILTERTKSRLLFYINYTTLVYIFFAFGQRVLIYEVNDDEVDVDV